MLISDDGGDDGGDDDGEEEGEGRGGGVCDSDHGVFQRCISHQHCSGIWPVLINSFVRRCSGIRDEREGCEDEEGTRLLLILLFPTNVLLRRAEVRAVRAEVVGCPRVATASQRILRSKRTKRTR